MIHIDTHIAVWLNQKKPGKLSRHAARAMRENTLVMSPMVLTELAYMSEIDRLAADPERVQAQLETEFGITVSTAAFSSVCRASIRQNWTRDPFDRLIVANAIVDGARLVTSDERMFDNFVDAVW